MLGAVSLVPSAWSERRVTVSKPAQRAVWVAAFQPPPPPRRRRDRLAVAARAAVATEGMTLAAFEQLLADAQAPTVLVDFCTTWCGPCQVLDKNMKAILPAWKDKVQLVKVDTEKNPEVAGTFGVHVLPTLLLLGRDGQQLDRHEGLLSGQDLDMRLRRALHGL